MINWYVVGIDITCLLTLGLIWYFFTQAVAFERYFHSPEAEARRSTQAKYMLQRARADLKKMRNDLNRMNDDLMFSYSEIYKTRYEIKKRIKQRKHQNKNLYYDTDLFEFDIFDD